MTSKLHYVQVPENHIVIDFDIKDEDGKKSFELNAKDASRRPLGQHFWLLIQKDKKL